MQNVHTKIEDDFVIDGFEGLMGTDPGNPDSDNDGFSDGEEILEYPYKDPIINDCTGEDLELDIVISTGETRECSGTNSLSLKPGFHAEPGSDFHGYIDN